MPFFRDRERNLRAVLGERLLAGEDFRLLLGENTLCSIFFTSFATISCMPLIRLISGICVRDREATKDTLMVGRQVTLDSLLWSTFSAVNFSILGNECDL